ncbi:MAG: radical SAM protein, partial [Dehalococcoidia bacterium]|nr:radical SAM protein [Dehalococcoidia bacterium]
FDIAVLQCDKTLIEDILSGAHEPNSIVSSGRPLRDIPSVEERMPEINASVFTHGRRYLSTTIPMLTSVGCPYHCDFCIDWDNPYVLLPLDRLEADLRYLSAAFSGVRIGFHDPNFGVKFDQVLNVLETIPKKSRNPFVMESTLSLLRGPRLQRLRDSNCVYLAPGVESWSDYSNKAGTGSAGGSQKVDHLVEHFELLHEYVKGLGANFIFGLDVDEGEEPVELTKEFMNRTPFVWPYFNIPVPYGETPFHDQYLREHRILTAMPMAFYYTPYLVTTLKHY